LDNKLTQTDLISAAHSLAIVVIGGGFLVALLLLLLLLSDLFFYLVFLLCIIMAFLIAQLVIDLDPGGWRGYLARVGLTLACALVGGVVGKSVLLGAVLNYQARSKGWAPGWAL
jgi:hypothetical protein